MVTHLLANFASVALWVVVPSDRQRGPGVTAGRRPLGVHHLCTQGRRDQRSTFDPVSVRRAELGVICGVYATDPKIRFLVMDRRPGSAGKIGL